MKKIIKVYKDYEFKKIAAAMLAAIIMTFAMANDVWAVPCYFGVTVTATPVSNCCVKLTITSPPEDCTIAVLIKQLNKNGQVVGNNPPDIPDWIYDPLDGVPQTHVKLSHPNIYETQLCALPGENQVSYRVSLIYGTKYFNGTVSLPNCCECSDSWISWDKQYGCEPDQCMLTPVLNVPPGITCFERYEFYISKNGTEIEADLRPLGASMPSYCVNEGEVIQAEVYLVGGSPKPLLCRMESTSAPCDPKCPCPEVGSDWLSFENCSNTGFCPPGQCKVRPVLNIPDNIRNCYGWYQFSITRQGVATPDRGNRQINEPMPCYCVYEGDLVAADVRLYKRGNTDTCNPDCIIKVDTRACGVPEPCTPDYHNVPWVQYPTELSVDISSVCPGCVVQVVFSYRRPDQTKNFPYQDLQIQRIRFNENGPCANCDIDKIYEAAAAAIIKFSYSLIGFKPDYKLGECFDQWRISNASCWSSKIIGIGPNGPITTWTPCGISSGGCCVQQLRVCRLDKEGNVKITPVGPVIYPPFACISLVPGENCITACSWAGQINGVYSPVLVASNGLGKQSGCADCEKHFINSIASHFMDNTLSFEVNAKQAASATLNIYDLNGSRIATREYKLSEGINNFSYNAANYSSGTYNYTITIDEAVIFNDQFVVAK